MEGSGYARGISRSRGPVRHSIIFLFSYIMLDRISLCLLKNSSPPAKQKVQNGLCFTRCCFPLLDGSKESFFGVVYFSHVSNKEKAVLTVNSTVRFRVSTRLLYEKNPPAEFKKLEI